MNLPTNQTPKSSLTLICTLALFAAAVVACGTTGGASPVPVTGTTTEEISSSAACAESPLVHEEPPRAAGADPFGPGPWYVNADRTIWVGWGSGPPWAKGENKKVAWLKPSGKSLTISGHRLDGDGEQLIPYQTGGYTSFGYDITNLTFPTGGCWEITGKAGTTSFTFVTRVRG
jgi:hypothetical protein